MSSGDLKKVFSAGFLASFPGVSSLPATICNARKDSGALTTPSKRCDLNFAGIKQSHT